MDRPTRFQIMRMRRYQREQRRQFEQMAEQHMLMVQMEERARRELRDAIRENRPVDIEDWRFH